MNIIGNMFKLKFLKGLLISLFICLLGISCTHAPREPHIYNYEKNDSQHNVRIVELGSELGDGSLSLKKVYIKDHDGFTHEILVAGTRTCSGGEHMLELCKYR